jgi:hypothetical protein
MSLKNFEKIFYSELEINNIVLSLFAEGAYAIYLNDKKPIKINSLPWDTFDDNLLKELNNITKFNLIISSTQSTILPDEYLLKYSKNDFATILGWENTDDIKMNSIPALNAIMLNKKINTPDQINIYPYTPHEFLWIQYILDKNEGGVFIDIHTNTMIIAIVCEGKLLFYNLLEYKTPMDMLYYVSSAINVVGLSDTSLPMYFSGAITEDSHLIEKVDPFFSEIKLLSHSTNILGEFTHFFISSIKLCEL